MSTPPPPQPISYPVVPAQSAPPSTVPLNYGDTVYILDIITTPSQWIAAPSSYDTTASNPYGYFEQAPFSQPQNAQAFVVMNAAQTIPTGANGLPSNVLYGDTVSFVSVGSPETGYYYMSGDPSYLASQWLPNGKNYQWTLLNMTGNN